MRHASCLLLAAGLILITWQTDLLEAQQGGRVQWIWFDEQASGEHQSPIESAPAEVRHFRKVFTVPKLVDLAVLEGTLDITADDEFTVWINGTEIGKGTDWRRVHTFDVKERLVPGKNVLAVQAKNKEGPAGLLVRLAYVPNGQSRYAMVSDRTWKSAKVAPAGWEKPGFDDGQWSRVKVLGPYGQVGRWRGIVWAAGGDDRFTVPQGFVVEQVAKNPNPIDPFSLVNLTFDAKGRLLVSQERGPILLCTDPDKNGVLQNVHPYCTQVRDCQGMCWVDNALLLVGNGPQEAGLYRVRDTDGDNQTDQVELLHKFPRVAIPNYGVEGEMGEHGPHALIHGPDGSLYLVIGNHAWAKPEKLAANSPLMRWPTGLPGVDQGKPGSAEDVLLPRLNDGRGHAANVLAPGGTIWRLDHEGKNFALIAGGFRNHYDAAFSPLGELFTFDSDMEWDVGLPWYRPVRACHCPPGADFVWRTGAANTPDYYIDSLPPAVETGRGSPVGVEFYDHTAFPEKYRGAFFMADWSIGVIFAMMPRRDGASYKGTVERFCSGAPMNVTDIAVGPDGALYFTMGGRGTQGGVYRIVYKGGPSMQSITQGLLSTVARPRGTSKVDAALDVPQPRSAWGRARIAQIKKDNEKEWDSRLRQIILDRSQIVPIFQRLRALEYLQTYGPRPDAKFLIELADPNVADDHPYIRIYAVWLLGLNAYPEGKAALVDALQDEFALVRRRACEGLIRAGFEPPPEALFLMLADDDRFSRTAARLVLQRIDPKKWADQLWKLKSDYMAIEGIIALCKTNQAASYAEQIFDRLHKMNPGVTEDHLLDFLRTLELALTHTAEWPALKKGGNGGLRSPTVRELAVRCEQMFPQQDWRANRELAILLTHFRREGFLEGPIHTKLMDALRATKDRQQQMHYFYCLRFLRDGWTAEQKRDLVAWFDSMKDLEAGHSYAPFMENMLLELDPIFTADDRKGLFAKGDQLPWATATLLRTTAADQLKPNTLGDLYARVTKTQPANDSDARKRTELRESLIVALANNRSAAAQAALRKIADNDPSQRDVVARSLAVQSPSTENWAYLVRGLESPYAPVLVQVIESLKKIPTRPKVDDKGNAVDPVPYRALLTSVSRIPAKDRWKVIELLRHWGQRKFSVEDGEWRPEYEAWSKWFAQTFPNEEPLPNVTAATTQSKWKFEELLTFLEKDPKGKEGDSARGRVVFEKANCIKCHKFGSIGEGMGPDLTTLKSRFKRTDILESIQYPSKVISDQYRGTTFLTQNGQTVSGLAAPQGNMITVLQLDGTKVTLKTGDVAQQVASTISAMPEKLLDELTLQEIADLFAFLESEGGK